jgi:REP element-mobilizing transposase RayT
MEAVRTPRIKVAPETSAAAYHCMSRTVNGERLFDDTDKEVLRLQLWQVAEFCGARVITYAILDNHFHVLVEIPKRTPTSDDELLRRLEALHRQPTARQTANLEALRRQLAAGDPGAEGRRRRLLALMGDVSAFMQLLKQRFSIWFNHRHARFGTLWAERFRSVLVESDGDALRTMATYIDLNCVRAALVTDPKDYRFCGYAESVAGGSAARRGLALAHGGGSWDETHAICRQRLFGTGVRSGGNGASISWESFMKVAAEGGSLAIHDVLRCRVRYFTYGAILGSRAFVRGQLNSYNARTGKRDGSEVQAFPSITDWGELASLKCASGARRLPANAMAACAAP